MMDLIIKQRKKIIGQVILLALLLLAHSQVWAHAPKENYIWMNVDADAIVGRFELNSDDVLEKLNIDIESMGETRLDGLQAAREPLQEFIRENFTISDSQGEISYEFDTPTIFEEGSNFLQFPYKTTRLPVDTTINIRNSIWLAPPHSESDRFHRSMVIAEYNKLTGETFGEGNVAIVFTPNRMDQELDLNDPGQILTWKDFLWQGMVHIGIGLDHILFIIVLLLGAVVKYQGGRWVPVDNFKSALWNTLKIVTIFTVAHSITLSLAALNLVNVSPTIVETIIAASIIAVALNNIFPVFSAHSWILVFAFGLFHGLGFASVMGDLQFRIGGLSKILVMFNVGVEVGQVILVLITLPILYFLRKTAIYKPVFLIGLSVVAIVVASWWVAERVGWIA